MSGSSGRIHSYKMKKKTLMNTFKEVEETNRYRNFIKTEQGQKHDIKIVFAQDLLAPLLCYLFRQSNTGHWARCKPRRNPWQWTNQAGARYPLLPPQDTGTEPPTARKISHQLFARLRSQSDLYFHRCTNMHFVCMLVKTNDNDREHSRRAWNNTLCIMRIGAGMTLPP